MRRRAIAIICFLFCNILPAAEPPNFTGRWALNLAKSQYGKIPAPTSLVRQVSHFGSSFTIDNVQKGSAGEITSHYHYTTDGNPSTNKVQGGESTGIAKFEGLVLVIENSRAYQGATLKQIERWNLTDANTLLVESIVDVPTGKFDVKQIFERQK